MNPNTFAGTFAYKSADQVNANFSVYSDVAYDATQYDTGGFFDPAKPERLTVAEDGYYDVTAMLRAQDVETDKYAYLDLRHFDADGNFKFGWGQGEPPTNHTRRMSASAGGVFCEAGDYFKVSLQVQTDAAITLKAKWTSLAIKRVG